MNESQAAGYGPRPALAACDWAKPGASPQLTRDTVDVWRIDLDCADDPGAAGLLDSRELERARRFHFERDAHRFIRGRASLRRILARYVGRDPASLRIETSAFDKPAVALAPAFNLSHSAGTALLAVGEHAAVGVDLEAIRPVANAAQLARRFFNAAEAAAIAAAGAARRDALFFRCWTRKEAVMKALGQGMALDPTTIDAGLADEDRIVDGAGAPPLIVRSFRPAAGWDAAVAVPHAPGTPLHLRCFDEALAGFG